MGRFGELTASLRPAACAVVLGASLLAGAHPASAAIELGVYSGESGRSTALQDSAVLDSYIAMVGGKPEIVMDYRNLTDPLLTRAEIANVRSHHVTPMITWQLYRSGWSGPTVSLRDVARGKYDRSLRRAADLARRLRFEVMIRFAHEMNGHWYGWSGQPKAYVKAWRHVVSVFRARHATNVSWVWSPMVEYGDYTFARYFPGDAWVDFVGLDGYNWGKAGIGTNRWESLARVFSSSYLRVTHLSSRPVMITETSSSEIGGAKPSWIRRGFMTTIPQRFPRVRAVIWFNRVHEEDWRINSSSASLQAFREVVRSPVYR